MRNNQHLRRALLGGLAAVGLLPLGGCVTKPVQPTNADGTYCHRLGKRYHPTLTCTPEAIPTAGVEAEAKRFEGTAGALTVFVLRRSWGDASLVIPIAVDGMTGVVTVPDSLVRLRVAPGQHRLSAKWAGRAADIDIDGQAGQVRVVNLTGSGWAWGTTFRWQVVQLADVKARMLAAKLVADVRLLH